MGTAILRDLLTSDKAQSTLNGKRTHRVLLVEDEENAVKYCKLVMQRYGIEVVSFASISALRGHYDHLHEYNVVLVDIRLTGWGVSGKEVIAEMYQRCPTPIYIVWSVWGSSPDADECLNNGASFVLRKKGDAITVAKMISSLDRHYSAQTEAGICFEDV